MDRLVFDAGQHSYLLDEKSIPSVTTVLTSAGISDYSGVLKPVLENAANRGSSVHKILEMFDIGVLPTDDPKQWYTPYLVAWVEFIFKFDVQIIECEKRVFHEKFWFAGTLDRIAEIKGVPYVLDIKTTACIMPSHSIQTSAYALAYKAMFGKTLKRASVYIRPHEYVFNPNTNKTDESVFLAALQIHNWKVQNDK